MMSISPPHFWTPPKPGLERGVARTGRDDDHSVERAISLTAKRQQLGAASVCQKAEVAKADEASGQDVEVEAT